MAYIKVKNNAGTEVLYGNVDTVVLPTSDGGTAVFRKWNGVETQTSEVVVVCRNPMITTGVPTVAQTSAIISLV